MAYAMGGNHTAHVFSLIDNPLSGSIALLFNGIIIFQSVPGKQPIGKQTQGSVALLCLLEMDSPHRGIPRVRFHPFLDVDSGGYCYTG